MMEHSSAAPVIVSDTVNTELIAYFADCKNYSENKKAVLAKDDRALYKWIE